MNATEPHESALTLPGLEVNPEVGDPSPLRRAVQSTLTALDSAGILEPRHAAVAQLALELADSVSAGRRSGRASAAAMAAAQLLAALDALPKPAGLDADAEWIEFREQLAKLGTPSAS